MPRECAIFFEPKAGSTKECCVRKASLVICGLLLATSFQGKAVTKMCNGCSQNDMEGLASESLFEMRQYGPLYVTDIRNGVVRKYYYNNNVTEDWDPEFDPFNEWASETTVETNIAQGIAKVSGMIMAAGQEVIHVNPGMPNMPSDVFQLIRESHFNDDVNNYINIVTDAAWYNSAVNTLESITGDYFNPVALVISIKFVMADGSFVYLKWDKVKKEFVRDEGTERDESGNKVPLTVAEVTNQTYVFSDGAGDNLYDMWQHLLSMGVPVVDGRGGLDNYRTTMDCSSGRCIVTTTIY